MSCPESLRVQAYFDGEVDAPSALELEHHIGTCAECRALLERLAESRDALRAGLGQERASPALRARIVRALDEATSLAPQRRARVGSWRSRPFWLGAALGLGSAALLAALAFLLLLPMVNNPLPDRLVASHIDSLLPGHLIGVESSDRHSVKPWFAGHADVSPTVEDFAREGFRLLGGRADYLADQRAAVLVYQHGAHVINVFSWRDGTRRAPPRDTTRAGYHIACWRAQDLEYCAVSDAGFDELRALRELVLGASARERPVP